MEKYRSYSSDGIHICSENRDMRSLKWDNINFEERRLDLEQSKKRAEVHLPININMYRMLEQQYKDFGFQEYVAPHPYPRNGGYIIYLMWT